jgi:hypothetical protein
MEPTIGRIIIGGMIARYLLVALGGHLGALGSFPISSGESHRFASAKKSGPIDSRPYWAG